MSVSKYLKATLTALALTLTTHTPASGIKLYMYSTTGLGSAYAGAVTGINNIEDLYANPAIMTEFDNHQIALTAGYVDSKAKVKNGATANTGNIAFNQIDVTDNGSAGDDSGASAWLPSFNSVLSLSDKVKIGLSVVNPYGLSINYKKHWIGRYHITQAKAASYNINPAIAYKLNDKLSLGAGIQIQYFTAELKKAVDSTLSALFPFPPAPTPATDGEVKLEGDDWGYGYNLGLIFKPTLSTNIGLSYRSRVDHTLKGKTTFKGPQPPIPGAFTDTKTKADITTPESAIIGISHKINAQWDIMASAHWTRWSRFKRLTPEFENPTQPNDPTTLKWKDSWMSAIGTQYHPTKKLTLRGGLAYEQAATPEKYRTPMVPDEDKIWLSLGGSYQITPQATFNVGYVHQFFEDSEVSLSTTRDSNNTFRGNLNTNHNVDIDAINASLTYQW